MRIVFEHNERLHSNESGKALTLNLDLLAELAIRR
jgi:hypothetical protein